MSFWSDHPGTFDEAVRLWGEHKSASQIALLIGAPSRSIVIGKLYRFGAKRVGKPAPKSFGMPKRRKPNNFSGVNANRRAVRGDKHLATAATADVARVNIMQLTDLTCRWPVGEPGRDGFGYCGDLVKKDSSYCPTHHTRCYHRDSTGRKPLKTSALTGGFA